MSHNLFSVTGILGTVNPVETKEFNDKAGNVKTYTLQQFTIKIADKFSENVTQFESTANAQEALKSFKVGESIDVTFKIDGKTWRNKEGKLLYFTKLKAISIIQGSSGAVEETPDAEEAW